MLEHLQSVLKTVKDSKPPLLMAHRFVTVRRGSPAARSGQIQPGDLLKAVDSRPVDGLQHRDLSQILRRAGNALRLSIVPRQQTSSMSEGDHDIDRQLIKGSRARPKQDESRFYSVDLERGPTGFGFSLRGGSEYNMGLYVLGLMDGGPAQRSNKMQVSDQLVEINGDSTAGMTHSQAVEQIRRGGHRIHLVLKKGNGYVPDYGLEEGALSPSSSSHPEEQVTMTTASLSRHSRSGGGAEGGGERRKERKVETKHRTGRGPPDLDLDLVEEEEEERMRRRRMEEEEKKERRSQNIRQEKRDHQNQNQQERRSRSLPRNRASTWDSSGGQDVPQTTKHPGSSAAAPRAAFSFLMPMDDEQHLSDSQSAASFSEIDQSAAQEVSESSWRQQGAPGPWLEPSPQRLTQVLTGSQLSGRSLAGGLSL